MDDLELEAIEDATVQRLAQCIIGPLRPWARYPQNGVAIIYRLYRCIADGRFVQEAQKCGWDNVLAMREFPVEVSR